MMPGAATSQPPCSNEVLVQGFVAGVAAELFAANLRITFKPRLIMNSFCAQFGV